MQPTQTKPANPQRFAPSTKPAKKPPGKVGTAFGFLIIIGVIALVIWGIVAIFSGNSKPHTSSTVSSVKSTAKPAKVQAPTVSLATLNAQAVPIITPVLTDFEQQMTQGQADAAESNAGDVSSAFHTWETAEGDKENVANGNEEVTAYNKADNAYFNAHQAEPTALSNWSDDAGNVYGDITTWANAEQVVAVDNVTGSSSLSTDQQ